MPTEPTVIAASREDGHLATASSFYPTSLFFCFSLYWQRSVLLVVTFFRKLAKTHLRLNILHKRQLKAVIVVKPIERMKRMFVSQFEGRERERGIIGGGSAANRLISKPTPDAGTALCLNKSLWYLCFMYCVVLYCSQVVNTPEKALI